MWHCNWANLVRSHQFLLCQTNLLLCLYFEVLLRMQFTLWDWPRHSGTPFSVWGYHGLSCLYVACGINGPTVLEFTEFIFFVWNVAKPNRWCGTTSLRWTWHLWCSSWCGQQGSKHHNCHWHMIHIIQLCSGTFSKKKSVNTVSDLQALQRFAEVAALWFPEDYPAVGSLPMQAKTTWRRTQNPARTNANVDIIGPCQSRCHETKIHAMQL